MNVFFNTKVGAKPVSPSVLYSAWQRFKNVEFDKSVTFAQMNQKLNAIIEEEGEFQTKIIAVKRFQDAMKDLSVVTTWLEDELKFEANYYALSNQDLSSNYQDDIIIVVAQHYAANDAVAAAKNEGIVSHVARNIANYVFSDKRNEM